uniref:Natural cytotoxicity triggering receptor 3 n=1 Tax=Xenopus tropicalis TaxID=8364 RepID=A0A6I8PSU3_XENTR
MGPSLMCYSLCASGCLLQNIQVSQIPAVSATEGSTVTLQCHYTLSSTENGSLGWYRWYRHVLGGPEVSNNSGHFTGRVSSACQSDCQNEFINNRSASIQLHRVQIPDTGMYICEVTLGFWRVSLAEYPGVPDPCSERHRGQHSHLTVSLYTQQH